MTYTSRVTICTSLIEGSQNKHVRTSSERYRKREMENNYTVFIAHLYYLEMSPDTPRKKIKFIMLVRCITCKVNVFNHKESAVTQNILIVKMRHTICLWQCE